MKIQNFPDIDLPTVTVTAALPGAAPAQMETEVARKIENSVATLQGVKHIYTKVQDGTAIDHRRIPPRKADAGGARRRARRGLARALRPAGRPARPGRSRRSNLAGSPILTYTVASSAHGRRGAVVVRRQRRSPRRMLGVQRRRRGRARRRRRRARCASNSTRRELLALNATAADISRQLRAGAAGRLGRPHRRRRRRTIGAHHRHGADRGRTRRAGRRR